MRQSNIIGSRKEYIIKDLKFNYDKLNDLFYAYQENSNVYSNIMIGEFHLELDRKGNIVGMEIMKASESLSEYNISKSILENIKDVNLKIVFRNNLVIVHLIIKSQNQEKTAMITMNNLESPIMQALASA